MSPLKCILECCGDIATNEMCDRCIDRFAAHLVATTKARNKRLRELEEDRKRPFILPKITPELVDQFWESSLMDVAESGASQWSQDAVDFAALLNASHE